MRPITMPGATLLFAAMLTALPGGVANAAPQKKEYLSEAEADKIREAGATGPRIVPTKGPGTASWQSISNPHG